MKTALILAAGKGTRMLPLTKEVPKPLLSINGRPFLSFLLRNLETAGYENVFVIVNYLKEHFEVFFQNNKFSFDVELIDQKEPLGTGHAVNAAKDYIKSDFAVMNGDDIYSLKDLASISFDDGYNYIYALKHKNPKTFGVLVCENEFLVDLEEKPDNPKSNLINIGLYKFTQDIFEALSRIEKSERGEYELTSAIQILAQERKVKVREAEFWKPLGKIDDIPVVESIIKEKF